MTVRCPYHLRSGFHALAAGMAILSTAALPGTAAAAETPAIVVSEPEGFSDLTRERGVLVDIYFGGARRGEAMVIAAPDTVSFVDPSALLDLLPELADKRVVETAFAGRTLPANASLACSATSDRTRCGRLFPETVGVILDRDAFRLDIFFNPSLLTVHDNVAGRYLPEPEGGPSMINAIAAVFSGSSGQGSSHHSLQDQLILGWGERRIRADVSHASELGFGADRLVFEWDRPELRFSAGALWAPGDEIGGRQKLIGGGVATQVDTRLDRDAILGSPMIVYLAQRARVDVLRDGRVVHSAIYEAGNQQIDTSNLPEGSYDIILRIEEAGRPSRQERRFYTKSRRIPSLGRTDYFAFGGLLVEGRDAGSLEPSNRPYFQAGASRRISRSWAIDGGVRATDGSASAEIGATLLTRFAQLRAVAVADLDGAVGGILQMASSGFSRLSFNLDLRHIDISDDGEAGVQPPSVGVANSFGLALPHTTYTQAGGIVSYSRANLRFLGTFTYRDEESQAARYSVGPSLEWDVLRKGAMTLTVRGDLAVTERGKSGFAGISLRLLDGRFSSTASGGVRASTISDDGFGEGPVAALAGAWNANAADGELTVGAGVDHQPRMDDVVLSSEFRHPLGSLTGDFVRSDGEASRASQYSLGFQTTFAAGAGAVQVAGKTTTESLLVARVSGARARDRFEVLVDEQVAGEIVGPGPLMLPLPAYRAYDIRIRPTGADLVAYDSSSRTVGLFPGGVTPVDWTAAPITIRFGRLVAPDDVPIARASIIGRGIWSETDDNGFFQIDAADDAELAVTLIDGRTYPLRLPRGHTSARFVQIGSVICCHEPTIRLGALDRSAQSSKKEVR